MSPQPAALAIVVVNFRSHDLLERNLVPVSQHRPDAITVVVDNWSDDDERRAMRRLAAAHGWHLIESHRNLGFGAGANAGVEAARLLGADTYLILNPDATIDQGSIAQLTAAVHDDPLALAVPAARRPNGRTWLWVSGACMALSEELWLKVGGFGDDLLLCWEDVHLAYRAELLGGRLMVVPDAVAVQDEGGTQAVAADRDPSSTRSEASCSSNNNRNRLVFAARGLPHAQARTCLRWSIPAAYCVPAIGARRTFLPPRRPIGTSSRSIRDGQRYLRASIA